MKKSAKQIAIGTRRSPLARWQAAFVEDRLSEAGIAVEVVDITTRGDTIQDVPLSKVGGKGLFTKELDAAILDGRVDIAVHSLKDLPMQLPDGLVLAAVAERAEPWDAFVAHPDFEGGLSDLPRGARLATSSLRRAAQLLAWRPDLEIVPARGNVDTRLRKLEENMWEGLVLAEVGLKRLGLADRIRERFPVDVMLPAVGQGAVAVVANEASGDVIKLLRETLEHAPSRTATTAERAFLARLEGGCQVPIGAYAETDTDGMFSLEGCVASLDGQAVLRDGIRGPQGEAFTLGQELAERLLERGAGRILREVRASVEPESDASQNRKPLALLLRTPREDDPYIAAFEAAGWEAHCLPLFRYESIGDEALVRVLSEANAYAGLILTSPRAIAAIQGNDDAEAALRKHWQGRTAFVVGPQTALWARGLGLQTEGEETGTSAELASFIVEQKPQRPLLFLSGSPRRGELPEILAENEIALEEVVVYRATPRTGESVSTERIPEWVVFFSPRGVGLAAENLGLSWEKVKKAAIGPTTAAAFRERGWEVDAVAEAPTPEELISALSQ